jgi:chromosome segregation ATPase
MSDVMLLGVLRMPMPDNPADMGGLEWAQVKDRMRQAADEIEKERAAVDGHIRLIEVLEDEVARLRAELAAEREQVETLKYTVVGLEIDKRELRDALAMARDSLDELTSGLSGLDIDRGREAIAAIDAVLAETKGDAE